MVRLFVGRGLGGFLRASGWLRDWSASVFFEAAGCTQATGVTGPALPLWAPILSSEEEFISPADNRGGGLPAMPLNQAEAVAKTKAEGGGGFANGR